MILNPDDHVSAAVRLEPLTFVLLMCVVALSVTAIILAVILCRRRLATDQRLVVVDTDPDSSASLATHLSTLHGNMLYALTSDDEDRVIKTGFDPESSQSRDGLLISEGFTRINVGGNENTTGRENGHLFDERSTRVMSSDTVGRDIDGLTRSISEHDIPGDPQCDMPRDTSA